MDSIGALLVAISLLDGSVPNPAAPVPASTLRPLGGRATRLVAIGMSRSETFRTLAADAKRAGAVVYVELDPYLSRGLRGVTRLLRAGAEDRMLLVVMNPRSSDEELVAVLGHELQHVKEIALARLGTPPEVEAHYRRHGIRSGDRRYETRDAVEAGRRVRLELSAVR
jgi:hypothetical protein